MLLAREDGLRSCSRNLGRQARGCHSSTFASPGVKEFSFSNLRILCEEDSPELLAKQFL